MKPKRDKYLKARGGKYKIYNIHCSECGALLFRYQKDGIGALKRCYLDRIEGYPLKNIYHSDRAMHCRHCDKALGVDTFYKPESRPAIRLFVGAVVKRGVKE